MIQMEYEPIVVHFVSCVDAIEALDGLSVAAYGREFPSQVDYGILRRWPKQEAPAHEYMVLIEDKGSGITLRQDLERTGVPWTAYNPGKQDKVARLHIVSYLAKAGRIYVPESVNKKGQFRTWARNFVEQLCVFPNDPDGHDDYVDSFSQALAFFRDDGWLVVDAQQPPERFADDDRKKVNPYFE